MKPKIKIECVKNGSTVQRVETYHEGAMIMGATDSDYESSDASACCELLAGLRDIGLIDLEYGDVEIKVWGSFLK